MNYTIKMLAICKECRKTKVITIPQVDTFVQVYIELEDEKVCPHWGLPQMTPISLYIENEEGDSYDII